MSEAILVNALEQLVPFLNEKNVLELVVRGSNKRIKAFQKVALDGLAHGEEQALVNKAIHALNANTGMAQRSLQLVQDVTKMQQLGLVLNGLNLCATCAGFAVMYAKLDSMSTEINRQFLQLQNMMKQGHDLQASYEFDKVLSEHTNMMDCRKTKKPYSEEKMRELVDAEYNVLKLLTGVAEKGLAADHQNMILSIFSMLSMFTVSLCYFDEQYYFNNRSALGDKEVWHSSHQNWMSVYDKLSSPWFIEMLQDYAMFETKLDTLGVDVYYLTLVEQIRDLREKVEDNQNPGLKSRFNKNIIFEDYSRAELISILKSFCAQNDMALTTEAEQDIDYYLEWLISNKPDNFANGREMRNLFETMYSNQANRLADELIISDDALTSLTVADLPQFVLERSRE